jgi:hypothetical protein
VLKVVEEVEGVYCIISLMLARMNELMNFASLSVDTCGIKIRECGLNSGTIRCFFSNSTGSERGLH